MEDSNFLVGLTAFLRWKRGLRGAGARTWREDEFAAAASALEEDEIGI